MNRALRRWVLLSSVFLVGLFATGAHADEARLPGTWVARDGTGEVRLVLGADRSYAWTVRTREGERTVVGTWRVDGATLVASPKGEPEVRVRWKMPTDARLELTDDAGTGLWLVREAEAGPPTPAPAPGPSGGLGSRLLPGSAGAGPDVPRTFSPYRVLDPDGLCDPRNGQVLEVFRMWIPKGYTVEGGLRWRIAGKDPTQVTRRDLASPAVIALRVVSPDRRAWIELFPEDRFTDTSRMPAASLFPPGSEYMGTTACPPLSPAQYVTDVLFRRHRAGLGGARVVDARDSDALARLYLDESRRLDALSGLTGVRSQVRAGATTVDYALGGVAVREQFCVALHYLDMPGATLWWPRAAWSVAAPPDRFDAVAPALLSCVHSIRFQALWSLLYLRLVHENARGIAVVDDVIAKLDADIAASRAATTAQIQRDFQPLLMPYVTAKGPGGLEAWVPNGSPVFFNPATNEYSLDPGMEHQPGWTKGE